MQCLCFIGANPLEAARGRGHKEVVRLLEAAGFTLKHIFGQSPIFNYYRDGEDPYLTISGITEMAKRRRQKKENKGKSKVTEFNSDEIAGHRSEDLDSVLQVFSQGGLLICNVNAV